MGQQFISQSFSSPASPALSQAQSSGTRPTTPLSLPVARTQPTPQQTLKGGNKDGIWPDDDEWWNQQEVVYEAFIDAPANNHTANPAPRELQDAESSDGLEQRLRDRLDAIEREDVIQETSASIQPLEAPAPSVPTPVANNIAAPVFPERFKFTEEELAGVVLDWAPSTSSNMEISDSDSDCGSDFELAWDDDEEENAEMDTETPPPSTPVQSSLSLTSPPVPTVTPKKYIATPTTPIATGRRHSFARIKGYSAPVHSPRTELVM